MAKRKGTDPAEGHVGGCYIDPKDGQRCVYWCPTGGVLIHLERMLKVSASFALSPKAKIVQQDARRSLKKWKSKL